MNVEDVAQDSASIHEQLSNDSCDSDADSSVPESEDESSVEHETTEGDSSCEGAPRLVDEAELIASSFAQFGNSTLPNSTTSKTAAVCMITAFVVSHGLTWTALGDVLALINALFGFRQDVLPHSKYLFRKLWTPKAKKLSKCFVYCDICGSTLESGLKDTSLHCITCDQDKQRSKLKKRGCFFTILDFHEQVKYVVEKTKPALSENLRRIASGIENQSVITDITEGAALYKKLRSSGALQYSDITVTINTDGSPVFTSSTSSVWPIQFIVNELPSSIRFKNVATAGLWFGPKHPNMTTFLSKFVDEVGNMRPVLWKSDSSILTTKAYVLSCCVDAVARAAVQNHTQYNGYFGCPWCLATGTMRGNLPSNGLLEQALIIFHHS